MSILQQQAQQVQQPPHNNNNNGDTSSLFSILFDALSPSMTAATTTTTTTTPRPIATSASLDSIGNFFTKVLSEYMNGVEYQRRRSKRSPIMSENVVEDIKAEINETSAVQEIKSQLEEETASNEENESNHVKARILHKKIRAYEEQTFFPEDNKQVHIKHKGRLVSKLKPSDKARDLKLKELIKKFNAHRTQRKLKFPSGSEEPETSESPNNSDYEDVPEYDDMNSEKQVVFMDDYESVSDAVPAESLPQNNGYVSFVQAEQQQQQQSAEPQRIVFEREHRNIVFPEQNYAQHVRKGRILNRPTYASEYSQYVKESKPNEFVVSSHRRPHAQTNSLHINHMSPHFSIYGSAASNYYVNSNTPTNFVTSRPTTNKYYGSNNKRHGTYSNKQQSMWVHCRHHNPAELDTNFV